MKDKDKVHIKKIGYDNWLPPPWYQGTFPIVESDEKLENIVGAAFMIIYQKVPYIVTAKHVIEFENPIVRFTTTSRKTLDLETKYFNKLGLDWISHPKGLDLVAIPFHVPVNIVPRIFKFPIPEDRWNNSSFPKPGNEIRHLGYPEQTTTPYPDGSPSNHPQGMEGKISSIESEKITIRSPAQHGASGGPLFVRGTNGPHLIGVVTETKVNVKPTNPFDGEYLGITTSIPIGFVKDILTSKEMVSQYSKRVITDDMLKTNND
jgi:hypothetical protein